MTTSLSINSEVDKILYSIAAELDSFILKVNSGLKITPQDVEQFLGGLERRDHALQNRLSRAQAQKVDVQIPDPLRQRLLKEIFLLEHDHTTRAKIEQLMAKYASIWTVLKKIEDTVKSERYKIKVDKTESGGHRGDR